MKFIKKIVKKIDDEIKSAQYYAEKYVELKINNANQAENYKAMSHDELKHANFFHDIAVKEIGKISKIFTPTPEMLDKWETTHAEYVKKSEEIEKLLNT